MAKDEQTAKLAAMTTPPRIFFDTILKPSYEAWLANPLEIWMAKNAVANADIIAEHVFHHWHIPDTAKIGGANTAHQYRAHLRDFVCKDFGLVWDIHDGHKHVAINRKPRRVTNFDQTNISLMGWGKGAWNEGVWGGGPQIVVTLDNDSQRALSAVARNVVSMWATLLADMNL